MSNIEAEGDAIVGKLAAAGVPATADPGAVAPFVLVGAPTVLGGAGIGGWSVDYPIHIVATPPGNAAARSWLLEQVELVLRTLGPADALPGPYGDTNAPAYEITYRRDVANPNC